MHYSTRSFLGRPTDTSWSQYWENEPDDPTLRSTHGHLFGLINLRVEDSSNPSTLGHQLIQAINSAYFSVSSDSVSDRLCQLLKDITSLPEYQVPGLTIILAVVYQQRLYLASFNPALVIFQRGTRISSILRGVTRDTSTISGPLEPEDRFFLCTDDFFQEYGWDRLKTFLSYDKIQDVEENFLSLLGSLEHQPTLAAALIQTHSDEVLTVDPTIPDPTTPSLPTPSTHHRPSVLLSLIRKLLARRRSIYVGHHQSTTAIRRHRLNLIFAVVILGVLSVSIYFGARRNYESRLETRYQALKSQFQTKFTNAQAIKNINLAEAQSVAREADKLLQEMSALSIHSDEVVRFQDQNRTLLSQTGSSEAYQPNLFYDTSLIGASAHYRFSYLSKDKLYLLDETIGRLDVVDVSKKSHQSLAATPDLIGATSLSVDKNIVYVLKGQQILAIKNQIPTPVIDLSSQITGFTVGHIDFWNGNLYLLSQTPTPSLWKFAPSASGFSPGRSWMKDGQALSSDTVTFAINGNIWTLSSTGQIFSYNLGIRDKTNLNPNFQLTAAANLVTTINTDIIAFSAKNLVYINRKTDNSVISYNFGDRDVLSLSLDSAGKTLFVLCSDQKIYQIGL